MQQPSPEDARHLRDEFLKDMKEARCSIWSNVDRKTTSLFGFPLHFDARLQESSFKTQKKAKTTSVTLVIPEEADEVRVSYVLFYFQGRGRGQAVRRALNHVNATYWDVQLAKPLWDHIKSTRNDEMRTCFPTMSVPMLYYSIQGEWQEPEACLGKDAQIVDFIASRRGRSLTKCGDLLRSVMYEFRYYRETRDDGTVLRHRIDDQEQVNQRMSQWMTGSVVKQGVAASADMDVDTLIDMIVLSNAPFDIPVSSETGVSAQGNLSEWISAFNRILEHPSDPNESVIKVQMGMMNMIDAALAMKKQTRAFKNPLLEQFVKTYADGDWFESQDFEV